MSITLPILYCWNISACRTSVISHRTPRDGHKVDTVSIAFSVRKVVAEMGSRKTHRLTILEAPHILPDHLLISEARPTVRLGLLQEFFHRSPTRRNKERLSRNRIVICGFTFSVHFGQEVSRLPIPSILSIVPVEGADLVCGLSQGRPGESDSVLVSVQRTLWVRRQYDSVHESSAYLPLAVPAEVLLHGFL